MHRLFAIDTIPHFVKDMDICDKINIKEILLHMLPLEGIRLEHNGMVQLKILGEATCFFSVFGVGLARVKDGHY